jgi:hypothetical protein
VGIHCPLENGDMFYMVLIDSIGAWFKEIGNGIVSYGRLCIVSNNIVNSLGACQGVSLCK